MTVISNEPRRPFFLGIEGGGTRTTALLADAGGQFVQRFETGPANVRLLSDRQLEGILRSVAAVFPLPDAVAIGLAGARTEHDCGRIRAVAAKVWPRVRCHATNDLETAFATPIGKDVSVPAARVLVLSGTGSCCHGKNPAGKVVTVGGWGHILGDKGSSYEIGIRALKASVFRYDHDGVWPRLGQQLLRRLQLNEPNELIPWVQTAGKAEVAALAVDVFRAAEKHDRIASDILAGAESHLVKDALGCARRLARPGTGVQFVLAGSTLLKQPHFARKVAGQLRKQWPGARVSMLKQESVWGAVVLAQKTWDERPVVDRPRGTVRKPASPGKLPLPELPPIRTTRLSPTERRHPRSWNLDQLSIADAIALMLSEDAKIPRAIFAEREKIARAVQWIARAFKQGGRLFYVGAGTSGRLGVLDASECPPTFRADPQQVQGIIAGGQQALWRSIEGAEDDPAAGARAVEFRRVGRRDVVVGIAASGQTPFVWGALSEARRRGAATVLLAFNPFLEIPARVRPSLVITPNLGPELLTGSTRLKAGTATKLMLNIFTTLAMVRMGKVMGNLMVDLNPSNTKLRARAVRIVRELTGVIEADAKAALEKSGWVVKEALALLARGGHHAAAARNFRRASVSPQGSAG